MLKASHVGVPLVYALMGDVGNSPCRRPTDNGIPGERVVVEGVAKDGTIEAIRVAGAPGFAPSFQRHAEHDPQTNPANHALHPGTTERARHRDQAGQLHERFRSLEEVAPENRTGR